MTGQGQHPVDLLPLAAAGSLAGDELDAVDEHVIGCRDCAAELAEWLRIAAARGPPNASTAAGRSAPGNRRRRDIAAGASGRSPARRTICMCVGVD